MTCLANVTGCRILGTAATEPKRSASPCMIMASISTSPAAFRNEPRPASKVGSSSSHRTAVSTASNELPPPMRTSCPASTAWSHPLRCAACSSAGMSQAPPWTTIVAISLPRYRSERITAISSLSKEERKGFLTVRRSVRFNHWSSFRYCIGHTHSCPSARARTG